MRQSRGTVLILTTFVMAALFILAAFAVDLGLAYFVKSELSSFADLASLAVLKKFQTERYQPGFDWGMIQVTLDQLATHLFNQYDFKWVQHSHIHGLKVDLGYYDLTPTAQTFTPIDPALYLHDPKPPQPINAARISLEGDMPTLLAKVMGMQIIKVGAKSASAAGIRHIVVALDISNSMDDVTYIPKYRHTTTGVYIKDKCLDHDPAAELLSLFPSPYNLRNNRGFRGAWQDENCMPMASALPPPLNYDATLELGGAPQPITGVFTTMRDDLLSNDLFASFYRVGLLAYGTRAEVRVAIPTALNNADSVRTELSAALNYWDDIRNNRVTFVPQAPGMPIFPGGNNPYGEGGGFDTGWTNTGAALQTAINMITTADALTNTQTTDLIILLSDGEPTCYQANLLSGKAPCSLDPVDIAQAKNYAVTWAREAGKRNITIHAIYFGADQTAAAPGFVHLKTLAGLTPSGKAFFASNIAELQNIFTELSQEAAVTLVPLKN